MKIVIKTVDDQEMVFENVDNGQFMQEGTMVRINSSNATDYIPVSRIITMHVEI